MFRIGVISDTHNFLDPGISRLFAGVDHILHAGDVGQHRLIVELREIAPVTAVLGNTDETVLGLPKAQAVELAGRRFLLCHVVDPFAPGDVLQALIARERPDAVIFGHTHKRFSQAIGGLLYFNPGYAGKSRFGLARSVAVLHCESGIRPEYLPL